MSYIACLLISIIVLQSPFLFAADNDANGNPTIPDLPNATLVPTQKTYALPSGAAMRVHEYGVCRELQHSLTGVNYMIPTGTYNDWRAFLDHLPAGVSASLCLATPVNCVGTLNCTACSVNCGGGTRNCTYSITTPAANGGGACPYTDGQAMTQPCNTNPCYACFSSSVWTFHYQCEGVPKTHNSAYGSPWGSFCTPTGPTTPAGAPMPPGTTVTEGIYTPGVIVSPLSPAVQNWFKSMWGCPSDIGGPYSVDSGVCRCYDIPP